jgi:hypothetical protein
MITNSEYLSNFYFKISHLDEEKKKIFNSILEERYTHGFPNKVVCGRKYEYKYSDGLKKENIPFLDEFNYYYYDKYIPSEELKNIIDKIKNLYDLVQTIDDKTFKTPANLVVSIFKIGNIKRKLFEEMEIVILKEKSTILRNSLLKMLDGFLSKDIIEKRLHETKTFEIFDNLFEDVNNEINSYFMPNINLNAKKFIKIIKWMIIAEDIKYFDEIEETYFFENKIETIFSMYENKFIEGEVNHLEEYAMLIGRVEQAFIEMMERKETATDKEAIDLIVNSLSVSDEEKYMIEDYLYNVSEIENTMKKMINTLDELTFMFKNGYV